MEETAQSRVIVRSADDVGDATRLLEIAARMCRVCGFEFDVASGRLIWLRQTHNIFEEEEGASPSSTRLADFLSPIDHARAMAQLGRTIETGAPTEDEFDAVTAKGAAIRIHVLREAELVDGRVVKVYGAIRDITQETMTSRSLRHANEGLVDAIGIATAAVARFEALISASAGLIYEMNADWTTMRHLTLSGHLVEAAPEPTDRWFESYVYADDRELVRQAIQAAIRSKAMFELEHRVIRADGQISWAHSRAIPLFGPDGDVQSWFGMAYSIAARKRGEAALRQSEARYRSLVEATSAVTWSCPPSGIHVAPQPLWMAFTGQSADEMLGVGWADAVHPDDRAAIAYEWERCVKTGDTYKGTQQLRRHDGEWRWMSVTAAPVRDEGGIIQEWFGMHMDITERKKLELELANALVAAIHSKYEPRNSHADEHSDRHARSVVAYPARRAAA